MFRIARNPSTHTRLPYLVSVPVDDGSCIHLAVGDVWPGAKDVFCLELDEWPVEAVTVEEVPVQACWKQGKALYLVLQRRTNRRSMFVWVVSRSREIIFWRTQKTMRSARPGLRVPNASKLEAGLEIAVDKRERYAWRFGKQKAVCIRRELPTGDYGVLLNDTLIGAVERKNISDLATAAIGGTLSFQLADLGRLPHAALVIEGRLSDAIKQAATVRAGWLMNVIAALQVEHPTVSWMFAETRDLAEEFAYRWLAAVHTNATRNAEDTYAKATVAETPPPYPNSTQYQVRDIAGRLAVAKKMAEEGTGFTVASYREQFHLSQGVAYSDLKRLVAEGALQVEPHSYPHRYIRTV